MNINFSRLAVLVMLSIVGLMAVVIWLNRAGFFERFDYQYVRYFYDHSHWTVPASQRKMGDALLYQIAGYELITNASFTEINPEAPPLGKYLIGGSILLTGSALWVNLGFYLLLLLFTYLVSRETIHQTKWRWLVVWLVAWQPLVWQQLNQSMLDLGQVTWLMGWLWSVLKLAAAKTNRSKCWAAFAAGLFLGLFVSTKIAFFIIPLLILIGGWLIYLKKARWLIFSLLITSLIYGSMYLPQILTAGWIATISLQKWILHYWLSSSSRPIYGITLVALTTGWYLGHWQNASWTWLVSWNPAWLLGVVSLPWYLIKNRLRLRINSPQTGVWLCLLALIISLLLVPLFDRYLVIVLPLLCIVAIWLISSLNFKLKAGVVGLLICWTMVQTVWLLPPSLTEATKEIARVASVPTYQDLWSFVDQDTRQQQTRDEFWRSLETARHQAQLGKVTWQIVLPNWANSWHSEVPVQINVIQNTTLGEVQFQTKTLLKRQNGRWALVWQPSLFLPEWQPGFDLQLDLIPQNGQVINANGDILAQEGLTKGIFIVPGKIKNELLLNSQVEQLTGVTKPNQELFYKVGQLPDLPVYVGQLLPYIKDTQLEALDNGILISQVKGRIYHPQIQANKEKAVHMMELERSEKNLLTLPAGKLKVVDPNRPNWSPTLISVDPKSHHDLVLTTNFF